MPDIATEVPLADPLLQLPEIPSLPEVAAEVSLAAESLSIASWPQAAADCPTSWSPAVTAPCASGHCFVGDVSLPLCDDVSDHLVAEDTLGEWPQAKRRRRKLTNAWNDIPALVNLIVAISIDEAAKASDTNMRQDFVSPPTNVAMLSAFESSSLAKPPLQTNLPAKTDQLDLHDFVPIPPDTNLITSVKKEVITSKYQAENVSNEPID